MQVCLVLFVYEILVTCVQSLESSAVDRTRELRLKAGVVDWERRSLFRAICLPVPLAVSVVGLSPCEALSPKEASSKYDTYAASYDQLDGGKTATALGIDQARSAMIQQARGKVLEIGVGTGLNLDKYAREQLVSLTLVDISEGMLREASSRIRSLPNLRGIDVKVVQADATNELVDLFGSESFDTVIDSFSLCTMGNEGAKNCLNQISKVVKRKQEGGKILLLENAKSSNSLLGAYQDATANAVASIGGKGCLYNQNVEAMISATKGLEIQNKVSYSMGLFRFFDCIHV